MTEQNSKTRFGFVAVIGAPNAGKSTLVNHIVGTKVSIVSPKAQTTRTRVLGVCIEDQSQISFIDTPGIFEANQKNKLERAIVASAWEGIAEAEIVTLLVDVSKKIGGPTKAILERLAQEKGSKKHYILVLNKIDKIKREALLELSLKLNEQCNFDATFMISALKGNGVDKLTQYLAQNVPEGPWHYPEDHLTDMPMRLMAAEVTREKIFHLLHQEIPYALTVETQEWESFDNGDIKIDQTIFINREAHKKIILGKGGSMIKKIGQQSRIELEEIFDTTVHLKLFVKLSEAWMDDDDHYSIWGLNSNA